jgi:hypothetical protein
MDSTERQSTTEKLKLKMLARVAMLGVGTILSCALLVVLPALYVLPVRSEVYEGPPIAPAPETFPWGALIPPVVMLILLLGLAYIAYDGVRLFLQYRKSKEHDEVMFP